MQQSLVCKDYMFHIDFLRVLRHYSLQLVPVGSLEMFLFYRFQSFPEVLVQDFEQEGDVAAINVEGAEGNFERFEVVVFLREIFEVVSLSGHGEAANRQIYHLRNTTLTTSLVESWFYPESQSRPHYYKLM